MNHLVTGATGNIGSLVTERLVASGERTCVFVRDPNKARARFGDRVEIRVGDLADTDSLASALLGIDSVFLLNSGTELGARDRAAAFAAKAAGVRHLVKLSSNALGWASAIQSRSVLRCSTGEGKIAFIHPDDIADVATHALVTRANEGESLVITGPVALSYGEMAAKIGDAIGRSVRFDSISDAQARKMALAWADSPAYAEALVDIWRSVREGRLSTVSDGVERIVGRKPIPFERWAAENADAFR